MKAIAAITLALLSTAASAQVHVQGHIRSNGTYVAPHVRSAPDSSRFNNYSSQGNFNPYTGQAGRANPYTPPSFGNSGFGNSQPRSFNSNPFGSGWSNQ